MTRLYLLITASPSLRVWLAAALLLAVAAGCHGHGDCEGHSHDPVCLACQGDEDSFAASTRVDGQAGALAIEIVSATPSPHIVGTNELRIRVLDADGQPADGVTFTSIVPFMAGGDHGTPLVPVAADAGAPGEYDISMINYIHQGRWTLTFELTAGDASDTVQFLFCVDPAE